jgi:hypothetical protein
MYIGVAANAETKLKFGAASLRTGLLEIVGAGTIVNRPYNGRSLITSFTFGPSLEKAVGGRNSILAN